MAYVTEDFYLNTYFGADAGGDFERLAKRASDDLDIATNRQIDLTELTEDELVLLQNAASAQIEFYLLNGDGYNESGKVGSVSLGSFSEQVNLTQNQKQMSLAPRARSYLEMIPGLLNRAVRVTR